MRVSLPCLLAAFGASAAFGCDERSEASPPAAASTPPSSSVPATASVRCRGSKDDASFTIGKRSPDEEEEGVSLPFAVEVGSAAARPGAPTRGFAVGALRAEGGATDAVVALLDSAGQGRLVSLGTAHGDTDPPRVAARKGRLFVVVPDNDAGSATLKLARIEGARVTWGSTLRQGRDESNAFGVELGDERGAIVWDEWERDPGAGVVKMTSFHLDDPSNTTEPRRVSPEGTDAEGPRLAPRPGGFWLAWIAHRVDEDAERRLGRKPTAADVPTERWVEIVPLDRNGIPTSQPIAVTPQDGRVVMFDLAAARDRALVAWRADETRQSEGGRVQLSVVRADGTNESTIVEDRDLGAGVPTVVVDRGSPKGKPGLWLSVASLAGETRLGAIDEAGELREALATDRLLKNAEPLAALDGTLLVARPAGLAIELELITCARGPAPTFGVRPPN